MAVYSNTEIKMEKNVTLYRGWSGGFFDIGHKNDAYYGYEGVHNVQITGGTLDLTMRILINSLRLNLILSNLDIMIM